MLYTNSTSLTLKKDDFTEKAEKVEAAIIPTKAMVPFAAINCCHTLICFNKRTVKRDTTVVSLLFIHTHKYAGTNMKALIYEQYLSPLIHKPRAADRFEPVTSTMRTTAAVSRPLHEGTLM